jgi:hypothetical protein
MNSTQSDLRDTRKVFLKKGTCSQTLFYILNREFGHLKGDEERASDLLAGGVMTLGYPCGMLWGATLAAGAEAFRRHKDRGLASAKTVIATQRIMESFVKQARCVNCSDITKCSWNSVTGVAKYFATGKIFTCFNLADRWAPEAIQAARDGLSQELPDTAAQPLNCACIIAKKMGASDEETVMVAGFAGGMGLSGNVCAALSVAVWLKTLDWCRKHPGKTPPFFKNAPVKKLISAFKEATGARMLCQEICGRKFNSLEEHSAFVKNGGCEKIINLLAETAAPATGGA